MGPPGDGQPIDLASLGLLYWEVWVIFQTVYQAFFQIHFSIVYESICEYKINFNGYDKNTGPEKVYGNRSLKYSIIIVIFLLEAVTIPGYKFWTIQTKQNICILCS